MNQEIRDILQTIYAEHVLCEAELDYSIVEAYTEELERLARLSNRCYFIVDLCTFNYIYTSANFSEIVGYKPVESGADVMGEALLDSKIHPDDFFEYKRNLLRVGEFLMRLPKEERTEYTHVFEMRVRTVQQQFVWVSWERQPLVTDKEGNLWLMLGSVHVLSNQESASATSSFFLNQRTGERIPFNCPKEAAVELSAREKEVLGFVQRGLLSKEIADRLNVSVHTVNIHRQNILKKMQVNNSLEAVEVARRSGILR